MSQRLGSLPASANLALYLVLLSAGAALSLAGCANESKPVTAETSKFRPADAVTTADATPAASATATPGSNVDLVADPAAAPAQPTATPDNSPAKAPAAKSAKAAGGEAAAAAGLGPEPQVPDGTLQELLAHIDSMARQAQQSTRIDEILRLQQTRLATAKKALAMNPDERTKQRLIMAIYEIYSGLVRAGVPSARAQLTEFAKTLVRDKDPEVARFGRHLMFDANLTRLLNEPTTDVKAMQAEVDSLLAAEKGALTVETLELASQAAELLMQNGHSEDAAKVMESLAAAAHGDPKLADAASRYSDRAVMIRADLSNLLTQMLGGDKAAEQKVLDALAKLLSQVKPSGEVLRNMRDVAMLLEYSGNLQAAESAYKQIEAAFAAASDPALVEGAQNIVASARKRLALVGQPFVVEGVTLDGKPFDWTPYVGKVVLVDFWATWCGPCLEELPNIRQTFDEYHARGFEVVGVNLNTKISDVRDFFAVQELPWQTVTDSSVLQGPVDEDWTKLPMAARCGVDAIPFLVLIGKDGKVDSLHVKGPKLKARLAQLLGEPTKAEVPPDPTSPAAPATTTPTTPSAGGQ